MTVNSSASLRYFYEGYFTWLLRILNIFCVDARKKRFNTLSFSQIGSLTGSKHRQISSIRRGTYNGNPFRTTDNLKVGILCCFFMQKTQDHSMPADLKLKEKAISLALRSAFRLGEVSINDLLFATCMPAPSFWTTQKK